MHLDPPDFARRLVRWIAGPTGRSIRPRRDRLDADVLQATLLELDQLKPDEVLAVGSRYARRCLSYVNYGARRRQIADQAMRTQPQAAWILSADADGHLREAALARLDRPPATPARLMALVLRLNDWVPEVRAAAFAALQRLLPDTSAEVLAASAPYLLRKRFAWGRWSADGQAIVDGALRRPDVVAALGKRLMSGRRGPLGATLRSALRLEDYDTQLVDMAFGAALPTVRAVALKTLVDGRATWPVGFGWEWIDKTYGVRRRAPLLEGRTIAPHDPRVSIRRGLQDRSALVRRIAAAALIEHAAEMPDARELAAALRGDRSRAVRDRGEFLTRHMDQES